MTPFTPDPPVKVDCLCEVKYVSKSLRAKSTSFCVYFSSLYRSPTPKRKGEDVSFYINFGTYKNYGSILSHHFYDSSTIFDKVKNQKDCD